MKNDALLFASLRGIAEMLRSREISPVELTEAALERIETLDPRLRAFITVLPAAARQAARKAEQDILAGRWRGPLHGVPIALKDLYFTRGVRTTAAARAYADFVPACDARVAERLYEAGAVLIGKTNMTEVAFGPSDHVHPEYGVTPNPWNPERYAGGSSTGSGIAVATGMVFLATGSDTGGSIRNPASFCGICGFKPTYGLVSSYGTFPASWRLDHMGPLARTAEDCAIALQAMAGYDPRDPASVDRTLPDYPAALALPPSGLQGLRIGMPCRHFFADLQPAVEASVRQAAQTLRDLGATLRETDIPGVVEGGLAALTVMKCEAAAFHRPQLARRAGDFVPDIRAKLLSGLEIRAVDYIEAMQLCDRLAEAIESLFNEVDLILTPTRDTVAPRMAPDGRILDRYPYETAGRPSLTIPFNAGGQPAISIPCGFDEAGLPVGLQLVARRFADATVLRAAHLYQQATDWHLRHPPLASPAAGKP
jgi:aspartyl-tRNA(Asn)/glutamyl-tRNA(Gln) amidotransferase subunit A